MRTWRRRGRAGRFQGAVGGWSSNPLDAGQALGEGVVDLRASRWRSASAPRRLGFGQFGAGGDEVLDQGALAGGLAFHVQEDGRGQSGHGGGQQRQGRVEAVGQLEFGDHDQRGHRRDHRDRGPGGQGAQHGVDQRDGAPGEAGRQQDEHRPAGEHREQAGQFGGAGAGPGAAGGGGWAAAGGRRPARGRGRSPRGCAGCTSDGPGSG